jgi:alpha-beta hydrolase superfamily lysophospholipase
MGGNLLLNYLIRRNPDIAAAVVSAPHIALTHPTNPVLLAIARVMRAVHPSFTQNNTLDISYLSRDPAVVTAAEDDPLYHDRISVETALAMVKSAHFLDTFTGAIRTPLLLMHGTADEVTDPKATESFAKRVMGPVELKLWPNLYHELHNEPEQREVFDFVFQWLEPNIERTDANRKLKSV